MMSKMNILFVCRGNVGRSQAAMSFYNHTEHGHAGSVGTAVKYPGEKLINLKMAENTIKVMSDYGIDVSNNTCNQISENEVNRYDRIVVMAESHEIPQWLKDDRKTEIWDIQDAKNQDLKTTRRIFDQIKQKIDVL